MRDPYLIDPQHLSTKPLVLEGRLKPGELERLEDSLANGEGELRYRVTAQLDAQRRKVVSCIIEGFAFLTCQTSLEPFRHDISIEERLVLVDDESRLPPVEDESDTEDFIVADGPLDIRDLVEDAVLLALPMMPRKPGVEPVGEAKPKDVEASPFAALAGLRKPTNT
jgi:uncharacterized protein